MNTNIKFFKATGAVAAGSLFVASVMSLLAQQAGPDQETSKPVLSARARAVITEKWGDSSFGPTLQIVSDNGETRDSRALAMEKLHANRLKLKQGEMRRFLEQVKAIAKDDTEDELVCAQAIHTMGNLSLTMEELGEINRTEATRETDFLLGVAVDGRKNSRLRGNAINVSGILRLTEASPILRDILSDGSTNLNVPDIARPSCLSLMRIDGERAIPTLATVLRKTTDSEVFGTAAFAVGQFKSRESMIALIQNIGRFPESGVAASMLADMADVIFEILKNPKDEKLSEAILTTRFLWHERQRERYIPLLLALAKSGENPAKTAAIERLIEAAGNLDFDSEKRELQAVFDTLEGQLGMEAHQARIKKRLSAEILVPTNGAVPTTR